MKNRMKFALSAMLLLSMPLCMIAQQPRFTKVGEFNIHNLRSIEERVVLLHAIQANEVFSYVYNDTEDRFDIFVPADYTCDDSGESPDFDAFIESCYDQWIAFSNLDKNQRGSLYNGAINLKTVCFLPSTRSSTINGEIAMTTPPAMELSLSVPTTVCTISLLVLTQETSDPPKHPIIAQISQDLMEQVLTVFTRPLILLSIL